MKKFKSSISYILFFISDIIGFYLSFIFAYFIRQNIISLLIPQVTNLPLLQNYYKFYYLLILFISIFVYHNLYLKRRDIWSELREILKCGFIWIILSFAILAVLKVSIEASRLLLIITGLLSVIFIILLRYFLKFFLYKTKLWKLNSALFVGEFGNVVSLINAIKNINEVWYTGYVITTIIYYKNGASIKHKFLKRFKLIKVAKFKKENVYSIFIKNNIHELFVYNVSNSLLEKILKFNDEKLIQVNYIPSFHYIKILNLAVQNIGNVSTLVFRNNLASLLSVIQKIIFDFVLSFIILVILSPVLVIIAIVIKYISPGPVFYKAKRIGKNYKDIYIYKFRTMYKDAEERLSTLLKSDKNLAKEFNKTFKLKSDPRITKLGNFLRKYSIDEIPQLINVLKMELSMVGPRPIVKEEVKKYGHHFVEVIKVKPGITGLWQISGRNDMNYSDRVKKDLFYIRNWSMWLDIKILFKTIPTVIRGRGAY